MTSPSHKETVKTVKTTIEIELQRIETVTQITCTQCSRTGEVRRVEIKPPASIGGSVASCRLPDGWWFQGASYFNFKGTCPDCFEKPFAGVVRSRSVEPEEAAILPNREEPSVPNAPWGSDRDRPGVTTWQAMLSTPGGASAVAKALASHLRHTAESIRRTSLERIVETLEAASARLEEFRPKDAADVDLTPLGKRPFAVPFDPSSIIDEALSQGGEASSNAAASDDLLERIERVCEGGNLFLAGEPLRSREQTKVHAHVTMSNATGVELTVNAVGTTAALALRSALAKAGLM